MVLALVLGAFALWALCAAVAFIKDEMTRFMLVLLCSGCLLLVAAVAGKQAGREAERLPNVAELCRGDLKLSWKVSEDDQKKITEALQDDAKCKVRVTRVDKPPLPAFPEDSSKK